MIELKIGTPELEQISKEVEHLEDVKYLVEGMFKVMSDNGGIGLAANQVGILKRIIVINTMTLRQVIINPVIVKRSIKTVNSLEGCLSFPNEQRKVKRSKRVEVVGFDENWRPIRLKMRFLDAMCVQHEIDHLNGITIMDER